MVRWLRRKGDAAPRATYLSVDNLEVFGRLFDEIAQRGVRTCIGKVVDVVDDQGDVLWMLGNLVHDMPHHVAHIAEVRIWERCRRRLVHVHANQLQRLQNVREESLQIAFTMA